MTMRADYIWMNGKIIPWDEARVHVFTHALHYGSSAFEGIRVYETASGPAIFPRPRALRTLALQLQSGAHPVALHGGGILAGDDRRGEGQQPAQRLYPPAGLPRLQHAGRRWPRLPGGGDRRLGAVGRVSGQGRAGERRGCAGEQLAAHGARHAERTGQDRRAVCQQPERGDGSARQRLHRRHRPGRERLRQRRQRREHLRDHQGRHLHAAAGQQHPRRHHARNCATTIAQDLGYTDQGAVIPREMLYMADEIFFTGTAAEITPVRSVDRMPVGDGKRGPITQQIQARFFGIVEGELPDDHGWLTPSRRNSDRPRI
jgi:branched-chain amino acid aminotransferase